MTLDEAAKIAKIIGTADGGCAVCVSQLVERLNRDLPEILWSLAEVATEENCFAAEAEDAEFPDTFTPVAVALRQQAA